MQSLLIKEKKTPIFMYSICAGTLHTTKALCELSKQQKLTEYAIRGLIVDSAVTSVQTDLENIPVYKYPQATLYNKIKRGLLWLLRYTIFHRSFMAPEEQTTVDPKELAKTNIPTLHINCKKGDPLTTYERTNKFYEEHKNNSSSQEIIYNTCFEESKHACHHLKHKKEYATALIGFIKTYLQKN